MITREIMERWMARAEDRSDPQCGQFAIAVATAEHAVSTAYLGKHLEFMGKIAAWALSKDKTTGGGAGGPTNSQEGADGKATPDKGAGEV